jgi:hypothetical protein
MHMAVNGPALAEPSTAAPRPRLLASIHVALAQVIAPDIVDGPIEPATVAVAAPEGIGGHPCDEETGTEESAAVKPDKERAKAGPKADEAGPKADEAGMKAAEGGVKAAAEAGVKAAVEAAAKAGVKAATEATGAAAMPLTGGGRGRVGEMTAAEIASAASPATIALETELRICHLRGPTAPNRAPNRKCGAEWGAILIQHLPSPSSSVAF